MACLSRLASAAFTSEMSCMPGWSDGLAGDWGSASGANKPRVTMNLRFLIWHSSYPARHPSPTLWCLRAMPEALFSRRWTKESAEPALPGVDWQAWDRIAYHRHLRFGVYNI